MSPSVDIVIETPEFPSLEMFTVRCLMSPTQEVRAPNSHIPILEMNASSYQSLTLFSIQIYNSQVYSTPLKQSSNNLTCPRELVQLTSFCLPVVLLFTHGWIAVLAYLCQSLWTWFSCLSPWMGDALSMYQYIQGSEPTMWSWELYK